MYDCDENGLNDDMQNRLQRQYWDEQQAKKQRIIRDLNNGNFDNELHRKYLINTLWKDYAHCYKNRRKAQ
tara:strand:+ start:511 stop:720 length:210 start_codon:yes stop_codon:yes gene_type:complete